jgi:hypothetical protein
VNRSIRRRLDREKRKITKRLGTEPRELGRPELRGTGIVYEMAQRTRAISCGGVGAIMRLVESVHLPAAYSAQPGHSFRRPGHPFRRTRAGL